MREDTLIFVKTLRRWTLTVLGEMKSRLAISLLLAPVAINFNISSSRSLNSGVGVSVITLKLYHCGFKKQQALRSNIDIQIIKIYDDIVSDQQIQ